MTPPAAPRASFAESLAGADSAADEERRRGLQRMKIVALSFLLGATVIFFLCTWAQSHGAAAWVGYVRAAAEAGMVGALADWFAVTALFKHPLGIPIPHTAIIKRKKDQLGEGLGDIRPGELHVAGSGGDQAAGRRGRRPARQVARRAVARSSGSPPKHQRPLRVLVEMLRDEDVQHVLDRMIVKRIAEPQWGPPIGRVLATLLAEGRQEALLQLLADRAFQWSLNGGPIIERVIERDSPTWSPRWVDHLVGDRIHRELMDFTDKVRRNPDHELRRSATRFLFEFADDLQHDEATIEQAEDVKEQIMARDEVAKAAETAWNAAKRIFLESVDDPSSALRLADRRLGRAHRGVPARRRRPAGQGGQLDHPCRPAPRRSIWGGDHNDHHRHHRTMGRRRGQSTHRIARWP